MVDRARRGVSPWPALLLAIGLLAMALGIGALVAPPAESAPQQRTWRHVLQQARDAGHQPVTPWPATVREVRFGVTPYLDAESARKALEPVLDYLAERIGVPVRLEVAESYADLGRRMRQQQLDLAKFSPLSYVQAKEADPGLRILLTQVAGGATSYLGYIVAREGDDAESLADLAGRSFCYVDPQSTSGYLYPRALLRSKGLDPDSLFRSTEFGGNHLACLRRVLDGTVDAGAAFSGALSAARHEGLPVYRLKILGKTARIPYDAYCVRSGLPATAAERIKEELLLLSTRTPDGKRLLGGTGQFNAWTEAQDSDYDSVRQALALNRQAE